METLISTAEFNRRLNKVKSEYTKTIKTITDFTNFNEWDRQARKIWHALATKHCLYETVPLGSPLSR